MDLRADRIIVQRGVDFTPIEYLNLEEINNISDVGLREIRKRHWYYRHQIFLNEKNIPDLEFQRLWEEDKINEQKEIDEYSGKEIREGD